MTDAIHPSLAPLSVPIVSLKLDPTNARRHPGRNLEVIKASLRDFGQRKPIIVKADDRTVIAGNGTLMAAKELGWDAVAAVLVDDDQLTATRYGIVDNRSAELAEWDDENLGTLLSAMIDTEDLGFSAEEIAAIQGRGMDEGGAMPGDLNPIVRYEIIFDNVAQQDRFYRWMKTLKEHHPDHPTVASRIDEALMAMGI
jgi:hypothetical protein